MEYTSEQLSDLAISLIQEAEKRGARLRLLGGLAFYLQTRDDPSVASLRRDYKDLDFAVNQKGAKVLPQVFAAQGWEADRQFNALHGQTRLLFYFHKTLQADVFIGSFEQCHRLELENQLEAATLTLDVTDLLLTKLQIHELNSKDVQDIYTLLLTHDVADGDDRDEIDLDRIDRLTCSDWGWYTTMHDNLIELDKDIPQFLTESQADTVRSRLEEMRIAIEVSPKSLKWQVRDKIGRRMLWYNEPEEVHR